MNAPTPNDQTMLSDAEFSQLGRYAIREFKRAAADSVAPRWLKRMGWNMVDRGGDKPEYALDNRAERRKLAAIERGLPAKVRRLAGERVALQKKLKGLQEELESGPQLEAPVDAINETLDALYTLGRKQCRARRNLVGCG